MPVLDCIRLTMAFMQMSAASERLTRLKWQVVNTVEPPDSQLDHGFLHSRLESVETGAIIFREGVIQFLRTTRIIAFFLEEERHIRVEKSDIRRCGWKR